jgi:Divergent InlB B-repeat domain
MSSRLLGSAVVALLALVVAGPAAAQTASRTYDDQLGDNPAGNAHDITSVTVSIDASEVITIRVNTTRPANPLFTAQDYLAVWLDTDPAHLGEGSGPDWLVEAGPGFGDNEAHLSRWVGAPGPGGSWQARTPSSFSGQLSPGGALEFRFRRSDLEVGTGFNFHAVSRWQGMFEDMAPNTVPSRYEVQAPLTVATAGAGSGSVASSPAGVTCPSDCGESFTLGQTITLTATPAASSDFAGWSGACTGTSVVCTIPMDAAKSVTARFEIGTQTLTVATSGRGRVTGQGIACRPDCSEALPRGTVVTLRATPRPGARFLGWSGACSGRGPCSVTLAGDRSVTAAFEQYALVRMDWRWSALGGNDVRLSVTSERGATASIRCVRSCTVLRRRGRGRSVGADLRLGDNARMEIRATKANRIGRSWIVQPSEGGLVTPAREQKCLAPNSRRPRRVACSTFTT